MRLDANKFVHGIFSNAEISPTLAIQQRSSAAIASGKKITRFGLGQSPFPVPAHVAQALRDNADQKDYLPVFGLPALRNAIASHLNTTRGTEFSGDNIAVAPGSKELLFLLQLVTDSTLLLPKASWVSYEPQAGFAGNAVKWVDNNLEDGWRLDPEALDKACAEVGDRPKILLLNYPCNPTGASYEREHLQALADVARWHGLIILADEIYWEISFKDKPASIASFYPEGTIVSTGLSKWCGAGGWRLGAFAIPDQLRPVQDALGAAASETYSAVAAPIQFAAVTAFTPSPAIDLYLQQSRFVMGVILADAWARFNQMGALCAKAEGGFYLMPDFSPLRERLGERGIVTDVQLVERLIDEIGVACLPGSAFGMPASDLTLRFAFVDFDGQAALEALGGEPAAQFDSDTKVELWGDLSAALARMVDWIS